MDENQDCREEIINKLAVWATSGIDDVREAKCDLYLLLSDVEITSRHTKVVEVQEDRNEYLLKNFLLAKQVKGCTDKTLKSYARNIKITLKQIEKMEKDEHVDKASIEKVVVRIAKRAGIDKANPHKFRRTCATMALKRGMPLLQVSKMLGHESTETTQIYLDLSDDLAQAHKKYVL